MEQFYTSMAQRLKWVHLRAPCTDKYTNRLHAPRPPYTQHSTRARACHCRPTWRRHRRRKKRSWTCSRASTRPEGTSAQVRHAGRCALGRRRGERAFPRRVPAHSCLTPASHVCGVPGKDAATFVDGGGRFYKAIQARCTCVCAGARVVWLEGGESGDGAWDCGATPPNGMIVSGLPPAPCRTTSAALARPLCTSSCSTVPTTSPVQPRRSCSSSGRFCRATVSRPPCNTCSSQSPPGGATPATMHARGTVHARHPDALLFCAQMAWCRRGTGDCLPWRTAATATASHASSMQRCAPSPCVYIHYVGSIPYARHYGCTHVNAVLRAKQR